GPRTRRNTAVLQSGQRSTTPIWCPYAIRPPSGRVQPHPAQVTAESVMSSANNWRSAPAAAFPSKCNSSGCISTSSSACWTKALCLDPRWIVAQFDERRRHGLDERRRPADVSPRIGVGRPSELHEHSRIDAPVAAAPLGARLARQRDYQIDYGRRGQLLE